MTQLCREGAPAEVDRVSVTKAVSIDEVSRIRGGVATRKDSLIKRTQLLATRNLQAPPNPESIRRDAALQPHSVREFVPGSLRSIRQWLENAKGILLF